MNYSWQICMCFPVLRTSQFNLFLLYRNSVIVFHVELDIEQWVIVLFLDYGKLCLLWHWADTGIYSIFNQFMPSGLSNPSKLDQFISKIRDV